MRAAVKNHTLPVFKKNRIALLLCIFETIIQYVIVLTVLLECKTEKRNSQCDDGQPMEQNKKKLVLHVRLRCGSLHG